MYARPVLRGSATAIMPSAPDVWECLTVDRRCDMATSQNWRPPPQKMREVPRMVASSSPSGSAVHPSEEC